MATPDPGLLASRSHSQITPRTVVVVILTALALVGVLYLLYLLLELIRWLVIGIFLAAALAPVVNWLHARRIPRGLSILIVYLLLVLALVAVGAALLPPLIEQIQELVTFFVGMANQPGGPNQGVENLARQYGLEGYMDTIRAQIDELPQRLTTVAAPLLAVTRGVIGSVTAFISILLITFFLLLDGGRFAEMSLQILPDTGRPRARRIIEQAGQAIRGYITGNLTISLIAGVTTYVVLTILGMPYALALALIIALFDLVPLVGAIIGALIVVIVALIVDVRTGVILAVFFLIYQQVENNILQPVVYGRSVRLHPLAVFIAVLAGGELLGILGALLAIPIAEIIRILGSEWIASRRADQATELVVATTESPTSADQPPA